MVSSPIYHVSKGFLYGLVIGLMFATAVYLLATAVAGLGFLPIAPITFAGLIFGACVTGGVAKEYGEWLSGEKPATVMFSVIKGFLYGTTIGLIFGTSIYVLALAVAALGFLVIDPLLLAGLMFGASTVGGVAKEYSDWMASPKPTA